MASDTLTISLTKGSPGVMGYTVLSIMSYESGYCQVSLGFDF
jgi:hypothetical protein